MPILSRYSPWGVISCLLIVGLSIIALFAPFISPFSPGERFFPFSPPSAVHWLGTDDIGQDILAQVIYGSQISLTVGLAAAVSSVCLGTLAGIGGAYLRGWGREVFRGMIDTALLIPFLPLMVLLAAYLGPGLSNIVLVISLLGWCSTARSVQARVLQLRELPFIESLVSLGLPGYRIIYAHILPNLRELILAKFIVTAAHVMLAEAALSFLGLGDPTRVSWGGILYYAFHRGGFSNDLWYWYLPPGGCIALSTFTFVAWGYYLEQRATASAADSLMED
ncbi:MAG TPA: ABC transporter permease [Patescibacteria group bacterium]|nr:ABC transporter permease [Patescibacteria group bacterium]